MKCLQRAIIAEKIKKARDTTDPQILKELAKDEDYMVRITVAGNPATPPEVLEEFAGQENWCFRWMAVINPNTPRKTIVERACYDPKEGIRNAAEAILKGE